MPARAGTLHHKMTLLMLNDHRPYYIERVRRRKHIQGLITVNSTKGSRETVLIYLMSMSIVLASCACLVPKEARGGYWALWNWINRQRTVARWVL